MLEMHGGVAAAPLTKQQREKPLMSPASNKIALFIDGANLYATAKTLGFDIDYKRLLKEFQSRGTLLRAFYYTAIIDPVGRANSPGCGHLKLPHLKIGRAADLRRVKQDVYFRSLQPRRGWGVERLEATAAKHSIYVT